jgi:hypothetical protein
VAGAMAPARMRKVRTGGRASCFSVRQPMRAALFQQPAEPYRDGVVKTENADTENHSHTLHRFLPAGRRSLRPVAATDMPNLLHRRRLLFELRGTCSTSFRAAAPKSRCGRK